MKRVRKQEKNVIIDLDREDVCEMCGGAGKNNFELLCSFCDGTGEWNHCATVFMKNHEHRMLDGFCLLCYKPEIVLLI